MRKQALKRTNIGISDSVVAYMVAITWTTAAVVKVEVTKEFKLTLHRVSVIRGEYRVLDAMHATVKPGQVLYFTKSDGLDGYYYMTSGDGCTCKAGRFKQPCHHIDAVIEYIDPQAYAEVA